jgi:hypothetical protein
MHRRIAAAAALAAAVFLAPQFSRAAGQQPAAPAVPTVPTVNDRPSAAQIVLAPQLEAEKPATLAVLDRDGRLVSGVPVILSGGKRVTTDATGRARFVVTVPPGPFIAQILPSGATNGSQAANMQVQTSSTVIAHPAAPQGASSTDVNVSSYSRIVALDDHIVVRGSGFRGDADLNHVALGEQPALVLASSPESLVLQPGPGATIGTKDLIIEVAGRRSSPLAVTLVSLEITRPQGELAVGQRGNLTVHINGTTQKVTLAVENLSGGAVGLVNGNFQRVTSTGGAQNTAYIPLRALHAGGFSVSVRVVTVVPDAATLAIARSELVAARGLAAGAWIRALDRTLTMLDSAGPDLRGVPRLLDEIEKLLSGDPPIGVGKHLRLAWLELVRD